MKNHSIKAARPLLILALLALMVVAVASIGAAPNNGKDSAEVYVVQLEGAPVVAFDGAAGLEATRPDDGEKIDPQSAKVKRYVDHLTKKQDQALAKVGAKNDKLYSYVYSFNGFAASLTPEQVKELKAQSDVLKVWKDEEQFVDTSTTPDFLGLRDDGGLWDMDVKGEDVIIGIVDSGIWPESESFSDRTGIGPNGQTGKLDYQQIPGWHGKCVPGEDFNASMCNQKLIGAQYFNAAWGGNAGIEAQRPWEFTSPRDYNGHGTHTASTSGGNEGVPAIVDGVDLGSVSGIAPRARIAAYKALWSTEDGSTASGYTSDLVAAIDQAVADGVDVINYSISGSRNDLLYPTEVSFLYAADAGIFVATSAGNSGPSSWTVAHNAPWETTVAAGTHDRSFLGTVDTGDGNTYDGVTVSQFTVSGDLVYAGDVSYSGDKLCNIGSLNPTMVEGKIVVCDRGVIARVDKSYEVMMAGGIGMVLANTGAQSLNADLHFVPTVHVDDTAGAAIRAYAQTIGATATLQGVPNDPEAPEVAAFSSRGPSQATTDLLKPDIMAPGVDILAAVAPPANHGRNFDFYSGTSMSSPHVAGMGALLTQAHPDWSPMMIKSALMTTTSTETNKGNPITGNYFDYGAGEAEPNTANDPGLVYDAGWVDWLGFLCGTGQLQASYCPAIGIDPSDLNYPSISIGQLAGSQTVIRTVTNVGPAGTYDVSVDAPPGIDVVVSPNSLNLAAGASATYYVTFTANDAVVVEDWTFGSLTWSDGDHAVTSPLVIYPVPIAVPFEVDGTGESGSTSFDVIFGYTGPYTADPHGLVANDPTSGQIGQDPDQTYPSGDDGDGNGVLKYDYPISGAAFARWTMVIPGEDDVDLYLEDSAGHIIAQSTNGGTDEIIELAFPVDGTYTMVVHGWGIPNAPLDFTLNYWEVPLASGGSLSVDSAPSSATVATTGTINVSWSGLASSEAYLGAVSHADSSGIVGLTLVNVTTP